MNLGDLPGINNPISTKECVISLLSEEWPLSAKEIYSRIQKSGKSQSYQSVHKVLVELNSQKILEKKGKKYALSFDWLEKEADILSKIKQKYSGRVGKIIVNKFSSEPQTYKFDSLSDASIAIADLFANKQLCDKTDEPLTGLFQYGWFTLNFSFKDLLLVRKIVKTNPNTKVIIQNKTQFGKWILGQYKKVGMECAPLGTNANLTEDIVSKGDYIAEISYPEKTRKIIVQEYNNIQNLEVLFKKFASRNEPTVDITIKVTKKPQLARIVRNEFEKIFNEAIKKEKKK